MAKQVFLIDEGSPEVFESSELVFCPLCGKRSMPSWTYTQPSQCGHCGFIARVQMYSIDPDTLPGDDPNVLLFDDYAKKQGLKPTGKSRKLPPIVAVDRLLLRKVFMGLDGETDLVQAANELKKKVLGTDG